MSRLCAWALTWSLLMLAGFAWVMLLLALAGCTSLCEAHSLFDGEWLYSTPCGTPPPPNCGDAPCQ